MPSCPWSFSFCFPEPVCHLSLREPGQPWKPALTGSSFQLVWPCNLNFLDLHTEPSGSVTISNGLPLARISRCCRIQQQCCRNQLLAVRITTSITILRALRWCELILSSSSHNSNCVTIKVNSQKQLQQTHSDQQRSLKDSQSGARQGQVWPGQCGAQASIGPLQKR